MVDIGKSDKMIKMSRKMDKQTPTIDSANLLFHSVLKKSTTSK